MWGTPRSSVVTSTRPPRPGSVTSSSGVGPASGPAAPSSPQPKLGPAARARAIANAVVEDGRLVCPHHGWDFALATGASPGVPGAAIARFAATIEDGLVWVDGAELRAWRAAHVPAFLPDDDVL